MTPCKICHRDINTDPEYMRADWANMPGLPTETPCPAHTKTAGLYHFGHECDCTPPCEPDVHEACSFWYCYGFYYREWPEMLLEAVEALCLDCVHAAHLKTVRSRLFKHAGYWDRPALLNAGITKLTIDEMRKVRLRKPSIRDANAPLSSFRRETVEELKTAVRQKKEANRDAAIIKLYRDARWHGGCTENIDITKDDTAVSDCYFDIFKARYRRFRKRLGVKGMICKLERYVPGEPMPPPRTRTAAEQSVEEAAMRISRNNSDQRAVSDLFDTFVAELEKTGEYEDQRYGGKGRGYQGGYVYKWTERMAETRLFEEQPEVDSYTHARLPRWERTFIMLSPTRVPLTARLKWFKNRKRDQSAESRAELLGRGLSPKPYSRVTA